MKTLWMQPCLYVVSLTIVCVYAAETHKNSAATLPVHTTLSSATASSPWNGNATDKIRNVTVDNHDTERGNHSDFITTSQPSSFSSNTTGWNANDTDGKPNGNFSSLGLISNASSTTQSVSLHLNTDITLRGIISGVANKTSTSKTSTFATKRPVSGIRNVTKAAKKNVTSAAHMWLNATDLPHSTSTSAEPMMWLNATNLPHSNSTSTGSMWLNATDLPQSTSIRAEPKMWLNATDIPHLTSTIMNVENYTRNDTMKDNSTVEATTNTSFFWNAYNMFFGSSATTRTPEIATHSMDVIHNRTTWSTEGLDGRLFGNTHPSSVFNSTAASITENVWPLHNDTRAFNASTSHNAEHKAHPTSPSWSSAAHRPAKKSKSVVGTSHGFSSNLARPWDQQTAMSETHGQNHFNSVVNVNVDSSAESLEKFKHLEAMIMKKMHDMEEMARGLAYDLQWRIDLLDVALGKVINQTVKTEQGLKKHIEFLINAKSQSLVAGFKSLKCDQSEDLKISTKPIAHSVVNFTAEPMELRPKPTHLPVPSPATVAITSAVSPTTDVLMELKSKPAYSPRTSDNEDGLAEWRAKRTRMMERWENNFQRGFQFRRTKRTPRNMS